MCARNRAVELRELPQRLSAACHAAHQPFCRGAFSSCIARPGYQRNAHPYWQRLANGESSSHVPGHAQTPPMAESSSPTRFTCAASAPSQICACTTNTTWPAARRQAGTEGGREGGREAAHNFAWAAEGDHLVPRFSAKKAVSQPASATVSQPASATAQRGPCVRVWCVECANGGRCGGRPDDGRPPNASWR